MTCLRQEHVRKNVTCERLQNNLALMHLIPLNQLRRTGIGKEEILLKSGTNEMEPLTFLPG